jgi:hypothetical protein
MKNRNEKVKKWLLIATGLVVSVVLIIMIGSKFKTEPVAEVDIPQQSTENKDVEVDTTEELDSEEAEVTVPPVGVTADSGEDGGSGDSKTKQKIQEDIPDKPTYTEEQLTDPTQKPNGEKVDSPKAIETDPTPTVTPKPAKVDKEPAKADKKPAKKSENKAKKDSSGGPPGFDNVPDGGDNQVIYGDSDGDIEKQIGIMD